MTDEAGWRAEVLKFWFGRTDAEWWNGDDDLDRTIRDRFLKLWGDKRQLPPEEFLTDPLTALAAVILFDQFPRNMFRGHAEQFATDPLALAIAKLALDRKFDEALAQQERGFLYMPFEHSERIDDQNRSLMLFTALCDVKMLHFAHLHHDIIERFGRFPHRNAMLGRAPRPEEVAAGPTTPW